MIAVMSLALAGSAKEPPPGGGVSNEYSVFPFPRVWVLAGISTSGPAHGLGASIGVGTTAVAFGEWGTIGPVTDGFLGVGSHSFIGDSYNHVSDGGMECRVLHRHYVRPGLLVGRVLAPDGNGWRVRPEVSLGAVGNVLVAVPVTRADAGAWSIGAQIGVSLGVP